MTPRRCLFSGGGDFAHSADWHQSDFPDSLNRQRTGPRQQAFKSEGTEGNRELIRLADTVRPMTNEREGMVNLTASVLVEIASHQVIAQSQNILIN